jgi:hypothetical protein
MAKNPQNRIKVHMQYELRERLCDRDKQDDGQSVVSGIGGMILTGKN